MSDKPTFNLSVVEMSKQFRFDPLKNFGPDKLVTALDSFRCGRLRDLTLAIDAMEERDDVLACVVPKAKSAVSRHGWEVLTVETDNESDASLAEEQKKVLRHFYNQLRVTNALDQDELGGVSALLRQMMDAKSKRYAMHNIVWRPKGKLTATLWFTPPWFFENSTGKMRFIENAYGYDGADMLPDEWLVTKGLGIGIACAVARTFKSMALRDWVLYSGRCGLPGFEGVTDALPGSPQWENMVRAVAQAASEFRWVRNRTEEIKTIEFGSKGELPFPALVERMDRAMSALWRGADLSTISAGSGQGQGASLQGEESANIEQDDAQWLSETLQLKVDRLVIDYVFGEGAPALAYFQVLGEQRQDVKSDIEVDTFLVGAGYPITRKQASERYSRALPDGEDPDELLTAPVAPALPGFGSRPAGAAPEPLEELPAINEASLMTFVARAAAQAEGPQREALKPILSRLARIEAISDSTAQRAALEQFRTDWPLMVRVAVKRLPALAAVFEQIEGTALVSGAAEHAKKLSESTK
jgi:phage gp29-like protein